MDSCLFCKGSVSVNQMKKMTTHISRTGRARGLIWFPVINNKRHTEWGFGITIHLMVQ